MRPLHLHFRQTRTVFSIDLPGYGLSDRRDLPYSPAIMTEAIREAVGLIRRVCGPAPIDALALSLSCEFLARAAACSPDAFRSIALVSPTGFRGTRPQRGAPGSTRGMAWLYGLLRGPGWGGWVFRQLTRPGVIRYFLERTWGSKAIDEALWQYDILATRVPGAEYAPLRFLSGYLFSADIHAVYRALQLPVWMCHGIRGDFTDYRNQKIVADRPNWRFATFQTGALPHFELPELFFSNYEQFLSDAGC
jgi:pimeloyl-ACP methyl ester carboxylesterase